ncbi:energy-coupling factor transporter ATPase [Mycoplasmopsis gallopavonis]|uniref:Energy-coupling factor transporter ATP-binding protein EcfA2 n=1 Tax=Mycoplasmopsis gallopavonis TaxID=76629 RepID=A0A449AZI6_9BACT|nr:energy-coupling factor transporter ATPase [Mycoplasmopsis gallopavonis]RIV16700.1 energy-coupling factor transporter ATPase [Mycoplasmopsis gallopavonis]VEU72938.1 ABC transporter ATP-binding protein [Mycoplasmopsis gallopavonis]
MQIKIQNIGHTFNPKSPWEFTALEKINLEIKQGEYVGIIGSTGSGKTTLIEHLNGILKPTEGEIEWYFYDEKKNKKTNQIEQELTKLTVKSSQKKIKKVKQIRKKIGIAFQFAEYQLFKATIKEDIAFGPIAYGMSKEEAYKKAEEVLELVGLGKEYLERSPFELSGGQKRRVALAGLLAMNPDVLVVDEPTAGLDPQGVIDILDILTNLNKQGKTIINVTHDLDNILERAKRILLLKKGELIMDGDPYQVLNNVELLIENNLQPPKILEFVHQLRKLGFEIGEIHSLEELAREINRIRNERRQNE